jgi:tRNA(Ile)-lysidine synthase
MNFKLRDEDSRKDEKFVEEMAKKNNLKLFVKSVDTKDYAIQKKISIEMAARNLRYAWFDEILVSENFDYIAIAHNQDDNIETYLINLVRGTGIRGMSGIKPKNGKIVRPLIFLTKKEIVNYLVENEIEYRTDLTNFENIYTRNKIRNIIIPEFEQINQSFKNTIAENIKINKEIEIIYNESIERHRNECLIFTENFVKINIEKLQKLNPIRTYLFEFLRPYSFNSDAVDDIILNLNNISGKQFFSDTHKLLKDREFLFISKKDFLFSGNEILIENIVENIKINESLIDEISLEMSVHNIDEHFKISKDKNKAYFDFDKIKFPLKIRKWKNSDKFIPMGMRNFKKISDYFIDNKVNLCDKQKAWIIESDNQIIWLVNHRIDDRFKITEKSNKCLLIKI